MKEAARVTSLDALNRFKAAWCDFGDEARLALSNAENDVRKTMFWLQNEQRAHWQRQIRQREKKLAEAITELRTAEMASRDTRPSLVLERKRVNKAKAALEEAKWKLERVRHWSRLLEREYLLYRGQTQGFASRIERDVPKALARLTNMMDHLDKYLRTAAPSSTSGTPAPANTDEAETRAGAEPQAGDGAGEAREAAP